jgi:hypothetical protein
MPQTKRTITSFSVVLETIQRSIAERREAIEVHQAEIRRLQAAAADIARQSEPQLPAAPSVSLELHQNYPRRGDHWAENAVLDVLREAIGEPLTNGQICIRVLSAHPTDSSDNGDPKAPIRAALNRLSARGEVEITPESIGTRQQYYVIPQSGLHQSPGRRRRSERPPESR